MSFLIGLLTFILVLVCLVLILLVLIQLPKKEAGAGVAFGGGATEALFGAGSGNALTATTKYCAIMFFGLALLVGILQTRFGADAHRASELERALQGQTAPAFPETTTVPGTPAPPVAPPAN